MSRDRSTYIELQSSCEPNRLGQTSVESGTWMGTFSSRPGRIEKTAKVDINLHLVGLEDHRWGKLMIVLERPNAITTSFHYKNWQQSVGVSHLGSDRYKIYDGHHLSFGMIFVLTIVGVFLSLLYAKSIEDSIESKLFQTLSSLKSKLHVTMNR